VLNVCLQFYRAMFKTERAAAYVRQTSKALSTTMRHETGDEKNPKKSRIESSKMTAVCA